MIIMLIKSSVDNIVHELQYDSKDVRILQVMFDIIEVKQDLTELINIDNYRNKNLTKETLDLIVYLNLEYLLINKDNFEILNDIIKL